MLKLNRPHWTQGLEIGPGHFELGDRYHEDLLAHRLDALHDHTWGIHDIRWDDRALAAGQLVLRKLDVILPDGTPAAYDAADGEAPPALAVGDLGERNAREVFLGIARDADRRWARTMVLAADLAGGEEPVRVECLRPRLRLVLEGDGRDDLVALGCARVVRASTGQLALDESYVPPLLAVSASPYLQRELRRTLDTLTARQALAARTPPQQIAEAVQRWIGSLIGSFIPRLAHLVHERTTHPAAAYRTLAELLGALSPFARAGYQRVPAYAHGRLGPVFAELFASLGAVLDAIGADQHRRIPLVRFDPTTLFADLGEPAIFRNDFLLMVVGADPDDLRQRVPAHFKVSSWRDLPDLVRSATAGVALKHEPRPPGSLPGGQGCLYFRLEKADAFAAIIKTGQLGIHHAHAQGAALTDIALFAVQPGAV